MKLIYSSALYSYFAVLCCLPFCCLAQTTATYCPNKGTRTNVWINKISIGAWNYQSGNNNGYFQKTDPQLNLRPGIAYPLQLELGGNPRVQDTLYWQTWVDANGDGDFEDSNERVFQAKTLQRAQPKGNIVIPYFAVNSQSRLRLVLSKTSFVGPCEQSSKVLEVEDYDFRLEGLPSCDAIEIKNILIEIISDSSARIIVKRPASIAYDLELRDELGTIVQSFEQLTNDTALIGGLKVRSTYTASVKLQCYQNIFSPWSDQVQFKTPIPVCENPKVENILIESIDGLNYSFATDLSAAAYSWRFRPVGEQNWTYFSNQSKDTLDFEVFFREMEVQLSILCQNGTQSEWSASKNFRTEPLRCAGPIFDSIRVRRNIFINRTEFSYPFFGIDYQWRFRVVGETAWKEYATDQSFFYVDTLFAESFEVQLRLECEEGQWSTWSKSKILAASNCPQVNPAATSHFSYFFAAYPSFQISWISATPTVESKASYSWSFREKGQEIWSEPLKTSGPSGILSGMTLGKTYEIRLQVFCTQDSLNPITVIETKTLPLSCVEIDESRIKIFATKTWVRIELPDFDDSVPYQMRIRQQDSTRYDTLLSLGAWLKFLQNLPPGTTYEISVRGYCFDGTQLPWSNPITYRTTSCALPFSGGIDVFEISPQDSSATIEAYFQYQAYDTTALVYNWRYRMRDSLSWKTLSTGNQKRALLRKLQPSSNYEVEMVVKCTQSALDSFSQKIYLSTTAAQCGIKPDTSLLHINASNLSSHAKISCRLPETYHWGIREFDLKNGHWVPSYYRGLVMPATQKTEVYRLSAFQFRIICPDQSVSPWSDTIYMPDYYEPWQPGVLSKTLSKSLNLRIAPNPSNGQFNILLPAEIATDQSEGWLEVYNVAGQKVFNRKTSVIAGDALNLDLSDQSPGMYLLRLKIGQQVFTERLLLSKDR